MTMPTDGIKISQLGSLASPTPNDNIPIVSGGLTQKTTPGALSADYRLIAQVPNTITYLGQRSYQFVWNSVDLTSSLSPGMRMRSTRSTAAPNQCAVFNGTTQYYSKISPSAMTFTDDFVAGAWIKATSYGNGSTNQYIVSRFNGTSGWEMNLSTAGQVQLTAYNAGGGNYSYVTSYQSIPLNKWVHVVAQLDMSSFTATTTTSYIMIDGVDVAAQVIRSGTNPTALVQAGNLEIGSRNGGQNPFTGKIAQVAIFNAKVTQATVQGYISQGMLGTETNLVSAYSLSNSITDLNTTNANNLTANGSILATNADSPFGGQSSGAISTTVDYGILQSITFATNTTAIVQVPEGCTFPTGTSVLSQVAYSAVKVPYGFPADQEKWRVTFINRSNLNIVGPAASTWYNPYGVKLVVPVGSWKMYMKVMLYGTKNTAALITVYAALGVSSTSNPVFESMVGYYGSTNADQMQNMSSSFGVSNLATATPYLLMISTSNPGEGTIAFRGDFPGSPQISTDIVYAENALL